MFLPVCLSVGQHLAAEFTALLSIHYNDTHERGLPEPHQEVVRTKGQVCSKEEEVFLRGINGPRSFTIIIFKI